jgi:hypothetical protein
MAFCLSVLIAADLAPYEERYLSIDGLGSAGMEADGVLDYYTARSKERGDIIEELKRLRTEAGDEAILAELKGTEGSERAVEYIRKVPLQEDREKDEVKRETRKGWFGRFR